MSMHGASTPSSTSGSSAGSPPAMHAPTTPVSPIPEQLNTSVEDNNANTSGTDTQTVGPPKRKPSRRANTAERRATHNAVERQRRETLNGRFLDLAALLPNLATVRRPSKSAIVNSSIALIHQNRRQRLLAARHLRLLKVETDALRRENNEWRDRNGLPRVEEQNRAPEFLELLGLAEGEGGENWWDGEALEEMGEEERKAYELVGLSTGQDEDGDEVLMEGGEDDEPQHMVGVPAMPVNARGMPVARVAVPPHVKNNGAMPSPVAVMARGGVQQQGFPMVGQRMVNVNMGSPTNMQFEHNPMMAHPSLASHGMNMNMYDPTGHPHPHSHQLPVHPNFGMPGMGMGLGMEEHEHVDKVVAWNAHAQMFQQPQQQQQQQNAHTHAWVSSSAHQQQQQQMFTPPGTAGSGASAASPINIPNPFGNGNANGGQYVSMGMQMGHMGVGPLGPGHVYGSPEADDASSVSSVDGNANSNANGSRSAGGSPQPQPSSVGQQSSQSSQASQQQQQNQQSQGGNGVAGYMRRPSLSLNTASSGNVNVNGNGGNGGSWSAQQMSAVGMGSAMGAGPMSVGGGQMGMGVGGMVGQQGGRMFAPMMTMLM